MKIGITGGIGSGKSFVCRRLRDMGYPVYDCDSEAKRLMKENEDIRRGLICVIGSSAYTAEGELNKPVIAKFLFADPNNTVRINSIVHPVVRKDFALWASDKGTCFMESAILFESGFDSAVDKSVLVYASRELRVERTMKRDNTTRESVLQRMSVQMDEDVCRDRADYVLPNCGDTLLDDEIEKMIKKLKIQTI